MTQTESEPSALDTTTAFPTAAVAQLAAALDGTALLPEDDGYAEACTGYNLATLRHPDVVVLAAGADDVVAAVQFANEHDLPIAVIATGHHATRPIEGGLLVNTSRMNDVRIDAPGLRAIVGAGARWNDVVPAAADHHLTPLHGSSGLVGVVGFTLGGGLSPVLGRKYGWGADHILALEVVTAAGELLRASATENTDLFWAIRGGRSTIGIVTAMQIELIPVSGFVGGGLFFDGAHAAPVLAAFQRVTATAPTELTLSIAFLRLPPVPGIPELLAGKFVVHVRVALLHSEHDAAELLAPLLDAAPVLADTVQELPGIGFEHVHNDPVDPAPFAEENSMLSALTPEVQEALLAEVGPGATTALHIVELRHLEGALTQATPTGRSVAAADAKYVLWAVAIGMPDDNAAGIAGARDLIEALTSWSTGTRYLNFAPDDDRPEAAFSADDWARLQQIKSVLDPADRFRTHQPLPLS